MTRKRYQPIPLPIGQVLDQWVAKKKYEKDFLQYSIWQQWPEIVGERLAERTQPQTLYSGILTVNVASSAWMNELSFLREDLIQQINQFFGRPVISGLRFLIGKIQKHSKRAPSQAPIQPLPSLPLDPNIRKEIEEESAKIQDEELRCLIQNARLAHQKFQR